MRGSGAGNVKDADIIRFAEAAAEEMSILTGKNIISISAKHTAVFFNMLSIKWSGCWQNKKNMV